MLLIDDEIRELCEATAHFKQKPLLSPFCEPESGFGVISYGVTHAGYDIRLAKDILAFKNTSGEVVDPKKFKDPEYQARMFDKFVIEDSFIIPAHGYILGKSFEYFNLPNDISGTCVGKSTYARTGIIVNVTPLEPGWEGYLTIEIANTNPAPARVYVMEGIAQIRFERLPKVPSHTYKGKKYDRQIEVTPARVL